MQLRLSALLQFLCEAVFEQTSLVQLHVLAVFPSSHVHDEKNITLSIFSMNLCLSIIQSKTECARFCDTLL